MQVTEFEFGYKRYKKHRIENDYHKLYYFAYRELEEMVKSKRQGLTIPEFLYNMAKYYESNAVFYEHARNIVLSLLIPLYLALLTLESIVNLSSGMYLFVMILIVIISLSIYYYYLKREKYYLFYLDIVKEYIQKSRYGLSFIKW